jgi:hypothetical protein
MRVLLYYKAVSLQARKGLEGSRNLRFSDFVTAAQDGGKVNLTHRPPLPPQEIPLVLISVRGWVDPRAHSAIGRILCQWKILPMTPAGIEPTNFWFVAQHLNHCATAVQHFCIVYRFIPDSWDRSQSHCPNLGLRLQNVEKHWIRGWSYRLIELLCSWWHRKYRELNTVLIVCCGTHFPRGSEPVRSNSL